MTTAQSPRKPHTPGSYLPATGPIAARHEAAIAQLRPGRRRGAADPAAADRRRLDLGPEVLDHRRGGRLLERGCALGRHPADARELEREPTQDARVPPRLLRLLEGRVA